MRETPGCDVYVQTSEPLVHYLQQRATPQRDRDQHAAEIAHRGRRVECKPASDGEDDGCDCQRLGDGGERNRRRPRRQQAARDAERRTRSLPLLTRHSKPLRAESPGNGGADAPR